MKEFLVRYYPGADADNFDTAGNGRYSWRGVEHRDREIVADGCLLIVANALVNHPYQVSLVGIWHGEGELALGIGFAVRLSIRLHFAIRHSVESKQDYLIAGAGLAPAQILCPAADSVAGPRRRQRHGDPKGQQGPQ